jgi:hypothetical protein
MQCSNHPSGPACWGKGLQFGARQATLPLLLLPLPLFTFCFIIFAHLQAPSMASTLGFITLDQVNNVAEKIMVLQRDNGNRAECVFLFLGCTSH